MNATFKNSSHPRNQHAMFTKVVNGAMVNPGYTRTNFSKDSAASGSHGAFGGERKIQNRIPSKLAGADGCSASESLAEDFIS